MGHMWSAVSRMSHERRAKLREDEKYHVDLRGEIIRRKARRSKCIKPERMFDNFRDRLQTVQHDLTQG